MTTEMMVAANAAAPAFLKDYTRVGVGTEALSSAAFSPPRIKLAQALSPELGSIAGLTAGMYFNSVTQEIYGKDFDFTPIYLSESYYLWSPRAGGDSSLLARADDGVHWSPAHQTFNVKLDKKGTQATWVTAKTVMESGLAEWGSSDPSDTGSAPAATYCINVVAVITGRESEGPLVMSFMRSALKPTKNFASILHISRVPSFGRVFKLASAKVDNSDGFHYEPRFTANGFVQDEGAFKHNEALFEMIKDRGLQVNADSDDDTRRASAPADSAIENNKGI